MIPFLAFSLSFPFILLIFASLRAVFLLLFLFFRSLPFCVIRVRTMLLSGAPLELAHWPLTVDVVSMVKEACSRRPVPPPLTPVAM